MRENWDLFTIFKVLILLLSSPNTVINWQFFKKKIYFKLAFKLPKRSTMDSAVEESKVKSCPVWVGDHYEGY